MSEIDLLAERFEEDRGHLRGVAYRMLGSLTEADDAVQEAWIRLSRSDTSDVHNLRAWLTTVTARVCLDHLRTRKTRREDPLEPETGPDATPDSVFAALAEAGTDPEQEAVLADSVGLALLVVLETLTPAERLAFVLHDLFAMPFDEIAPILDREPAAARQLASRARRRLQGTTAVPEADLHRRREVVEAFLAASRDGDFDALVSVLDPDVVLHADAFAAAGGNPVEVHGAIAVATGARRFAERSRYARLALVDGLPGVVVAPNGRLLVVQQFTIEGDRVVGIEIVADPARLATIELALLDA